MKALALAFVLFSSTTTYAADAPQPKVPPAAKPEPAPLPEAQVTAHNPMAADQPARPQVDPNQPITITLKAGMIGTLLQLVLQPSAQQVELSNTIAQQADAQVRAAQARARSAQVPQK